MFVVQFEVNMLSKVFEIIDHMIASQNYLTKMVKDNVDKAIEPYPNIESDRQLIKEREAYTNALTNLKQRILEETEHE